MSRGLQWSLSVAILWGLGTGEAFATDPATPASTKPQPASPLTPEESLQHIQVDPECRVELVAAEPDVSAPVSIAFDEKGQLWVVEMGDYPNGPAPGEAPKSRIRILTDDNGDGRFDKPRVFVDGLLFANSLMHWDGGVLVTTDGKLVYFKDTDNDGKADLREVWFEGFATENPQLRCNHPTLGPDNWIYVANGLRNGKVKAVRPTWPRKAPDSAKLGEPVDIAGRDFRFNPFTGECEAVSGYGQFGLTFDDAGNRYVCSNRNPCMKIIIEERHLKLNPNYAVRSVYEDVSPAGEQSKLYPISRAWTTSNLHAGQFSAACGLIIYRGTALPKGFYGQNFTCDPTGNLVHCDYRDFPADERPQEKEFLASDETWFRPVNTAMGPDGALYIVDMYRAVIEHPDYMPTELKNRPDLNIGAERGRIWRIVSKNGEPGGVSPRSVPLPTEPVEIANLVIHPNGWHRDTAQRLLVERHLELNLSGESTVTNTLRAYLKDDAFPAGSVVALRTLAGMKALQPQDLSKIIDDETHRETTYAFGVTHLPVLLIESIKESENFIAEDEQLQRVLIDFARRPWSTGAVPITHLSLGQLGDKYREERIKMSIRDLLFGLDQRESTPRSIILAERPFLDEIVMEALFEIYRLTGGPMPARQFIKPILPAELTGVALKTASNENAAKIIGHLCLLNDYKGIANGLKVLQARGISVHALCEQDSVLKARWMRFCVGVVAATRNTQNEELMALALPVCSFLEIEQKQEVLSLLADADLSPQLRSEVVRITSELPDPRGLELLSSSLSTGPPALRSDIISALLTSEPRITKLLDLVESNQVSFLEIGQTRLASLQQVKTPEIQERVKKLIAANAPADRSKVLAEYQAALTHEHDPLRGRELFAKNCAQCHKVGDIGVEVAPNISDSRVKTQEQLLVDILDPNRAIDNNYFSYTLIETSGKVSTGIISSETSSSVTLKQPEGKTITILRSDIEELKPNGASLMPVGFEKQLTVAQLADVISFVKNWRYLDGQVPKEVIK